MPFDLAQIRAEIASEVLVSPLPEPLAVAAVSDCFRLAGVRPMLLKDWGVLKGPLFPGQLGMLAHFLAFPALRSATVETLHQTKRAMADTLVDFFARIAPLEAEMIRSNQFRQEETLRAWAACVGGAIGGESTEQSAARLAQLDYKRTLVEYQAAEAARKAEQARREAELKAAAEREAEARGWRE